MPYTVYDGMFIYGIYMYIVFDNISSYILYYILLLATNMCDFM